MKIRITARDGELKERLPYVLRAVVALANRSANRSTEDLCKAVSNGNKPHLVRALKDYQERATVHARLVRELMQEQIDAILAEV